MAHARTASIPSLRRVWLASIVLGSIGAHLVSEYAAMGSDAEAVTLSSRHIYLGIAAIGALAVIARDLAALFASASGARDAKRLAELGLATLPFAGRRHFWLITAAMQMAIGGLTEIGEGCPLCGHDVSAGVVGALFGAVVMALAARGLSKRLPAVASAIVELTPIADGQDMWKPAARQPVRVLPECFHDSRLFNRPPPQIQSS